MCIFMSIYRYIHERRPLCAPPPLTHIFSTCSLMKPMPSVIFSPVPAIWEVAVISPTLWSCCWTCAGVGVPAKLSNVLLEMQWRCVTYHFLLQYDFCDTMLDSL